MGLDADNLIRLHTLYLPHPVAEILQTISTPYVLPQQPLWPAWRLRRPTLRKIVVPSHISMALPLRLHQQHTAIAKLL